MSDLSAIILAAGQGTRMHSEGPKVLHEVAGRAMVCWVVDACIEAGCGRIVVVVGHGRQAVERAVRPAANGRTSIELVVQEQQRGTGHAVECSRELFARDRTQAGKSVFVLAGDGPLIRARTLGALADRHQSSGAVATLATSVIEDPSGYGRIIRDDGGRFSAIVEDKNLTAEQRSIREVNPSYYCFEVGALFDALERLEPDDASGELYLTDVPALLLGDGGRVEVIDAVPSADVLSVNTPEQLAKVDRLLRRRLGGSGSTAAVTGARGGQA